MQRNGNSRKNARARIVASARDSAKGHRTRPEPEGKICMGLPICILLLQRWQDILQGIGLSWFLTPFWNFSSVSNPWRKS